MSPRELAQDYPFRVYLKQLREKNNLTQKQVGEAVGLSPITVSGWEIGRGLPDIQTLPLLADLFGVAIDQLFGRDAPLADRSVNVTLTPIFGSVRCLRGQIHCLDFRGSWPLPAKLRDAAGPDGLLFAVAPPNAREDAGIEPGALVAVLVGKSFDGEALCGVCMGREPMRFLRARREADGYLLRTRKGEETKILAGAGATAQFRMIGPVAGIWCGANLDKADDTRP